MRTSLEISYRNLPVSQALNENIRERLAKLERVCSDVISCHVTLALPHVGHRHGDRFEVTVTLKVPDKDLVAVRGPASDVYVAARDAFDAVQRQLTQYLARRRGDVKRHVDAVVAA